MNAIGKKKIIVVGGGFAGIEKALQQTQGWTDFICSMKAFLYCGINLRNGRTKGSY